MNSKSNMTQVEVDKIDNKSGVAYIEAEKIDFAAKKKEIRDYLEEIRMPALKKKLLKLYEDIEEKLKSSPAAIKHHHVYPGGLYDHTREVIENALILFELYKDNMANYFNRDDVILIALIHDLEKLTKYRVNRSRNMNRNEPYFEYNYGKIDMNDTAEVVNLMSRYGIVLTDEHLNALTYPMGGWSLDKGKLTFLAVLIHIADLLSVNLEKRRTE